MADRLPRVPSREEKQKNLLRKSPEEVDLSKGHFLLSSFLGDARQELAPLPFSMVARVSQGLLPPPFWMKLKRTWVTRIRRNIGVCQPLRKGFHVAGLFLQVVDMRSFATYPFIHIRV